MGSCSGWNKSAGWRRRKTASTANTVGSQPCWAVRGDERTIGARDGCWRACGPAGGTARSVSLIGFIWVLRGQVELDAATILARTGLAGVVELAPRHQAHHTAFVCLVPTVAASEAVGAFAGHLRGPPIRRRRTRS